MYEGTELELFKHAINWKNYYGCFIKPFLHGRILEVGAGIGETTRILCKGTQREWICLEPDERLLWQIKEKVENSTLPACCKAVAGTIDHLSTNDYFDAILYIDVIEHIKDDTAELQKAAERLKLGGALIVLVPAHQWLYSPFDKAIGHYRRYNKKSLLKAGPERLTLTWAIYLDSAGLMASAINKLLLKQSVPEKKQILFWDRILVNISKATDKILAYKVGKSVLAIWHNV